MVVPKIIIRIVMSQGRGSGNCCSMPRTTVSRVSSLLGDNSLTVSQVVTKELSRYRINIIHDVIIIMSIVTLYKCI